MDDTESVEWSLQGDREVNASSDEEGEILADLREAFRTLDGVCVCHSHFSNNVLRG